MREFILYSRKSVTTPSFPLNDLPSKGGRMDLIARCVISSLWISRALRKDSRFYTVLNGPPNPPLTVNFDGKNLKSVSPNERNIASWIKKALDLWLKVEERAGEWFDVQEGIKISKMSFQELVKKFENRNIYVLHEKGKNIRNKKIENNPIFILGDHIGLPKNEESFVERFGAKKISLGAHSYLASQSITIVHNELDRRNL